MLKVFFFLLLSLFAHSKDVWIDTDPAIGLRFKDPDDGIALIHAFLSPELNIKGISTIFGNTNNHAHMIYITKFLSEWMERDIPVYQGAKSSKDLGIDNNATLALEKELEKGLLTIISMGRLTNIATLILKRPDLILNITEVIVNAGRRLEYETYFGRNQIIFPDTNIDGDIEATKVLVKNQIKITMISVESMNDILWTKSDFRSLTHLHGLFYWLYDKTKMWSSFWRIFPGSIGFIPWDVYLVSYLTHPEDFECKSMPYDIKMLRNNTHSLFKRNKQLQKYFLVGSPSLENSPIGTYCHSIKPNHKKTLLSFWEEQITSTLK